MKNYSFSGKILSKRGGRGGRHLRCFSARERDPNVFRPEFRPNFILTHRPIYVYALKCLMFFLHEITKTVHTSFSVKSFSGVRIILYDKQFRYINSNITTHNLKFRFSNFARIRPE